MQSMPEGVSAQAKTFAGGYSPPSYTPQSFQPGATPTLGSYTGGLGQFGAGQYPTAGEVRKQQGYKDVADRQRAIFGPELAAILGISDTRPVQRNDIAGIQTRLIFENRDLAEQDLQRGIQALIGGRGDIGGDPASQLAQAIAMQRAQEGGQFSQDYLDQQRGLIRNRGAIAGQAGQRDFAAELARRGITGPLAAQQIAEMSQANALGTQGQLADFEQQAALAREEAQRAALAQLQDLASNNQSQRSAFDQAIANAYLQNQRETPDITGLLQSTKHGKKAVGGSTEKMKRKR
jgi:hypothetical protein